PTAICGQGVHVAMKGVSTLISYVLVIGIIIAGIVAVLSIGRPVLQESRDAASIDQARTTLLGLDDAIRGIASQGRFSRTVYSFSFRQGVYHLNPESDAIIYRIRTTAGIISSNASRQFGNLLLKAEGSKPKNVSLVINYTDIDLQGADESLGPGFYDLTLTNQGANNSRTVVEVELR
ncbi:MAG: hypothetical protein SVU32_01840, partial [Candidatus Nanohaloarchaea archaeon]|nr:hypothetical protein [Candidatus Nanohaloarchaea archaeon]